MLVQQNEDGIMTYKGGHTHLNTPQPELDQDHHIEIVYLLAYFFASSQGVLPDTIDPLRCYDPSGAYSTTDANWPSHTTTNYRNLGDI